MSKTKRVGFKLDMTPMVDVGFLLLTFFMLSTTFKPQDVAEVSIPVSHSAFKLPDIDVMTVTVDKEGGIYLGVDNQNLRGALFGPQYVLKAGVAVTLAELPELLRNARIRNPKLRTVIKADRDSEYKVIQSVMETLQKENITRFNLVTDMEK
jgi:biopolymer transport protein ExbD